MSNYIQGLRDAMEACKGVRESGCEARAGAAECIDAINDAIIVALAAPAVANGAHDSNEILPDEFWNLVADCGGTKDLGKNARLLQEWVKSYASAAIAASSPKEALTDEQIVSAVKSAIKNGSLSWLGYSLDEDSKYTIPVLSKSDFQFARIIEANAGPNAALVVALQMTLPLAEQLGRSFGADPSKDPEFIAARAALTAAGVTP